MKGAKLLLLFLLAASAEDADYGENFKFNINNNNIKIVGNELLKVNKWLYILIDYRY